MGQGGYTIAEWNSVAKSDPIFQAAFADLDIKMIGKCSADWAPKTMGYLVPGAGQFGRTTILPELFDDANAAIMTNWRQALSAVGNQTLITGNGSAQIMPEDVKVGWLGLAFPNKDQNITEIRWQIGDRKYGRINIEEMHCYNCPAIIFEEGFILNEEENFELYGYVQGPLPASGHAYLYQSIVMLGATYFKFIDKVLGNCGASIT